ncbi:MAG: alpha/beta fold hydrolase [Gemmatimonadales bacterium]
MTFSRRSLTLLAAFAVLAVSTATPVSAQRARQGLLSLETARIFYEVVGEGDAILVIHGGPGLDHSYLQPGLDALAIRHTLVYFDQRGTGRSVAGLDSTAINVDAFMEDIDALRQTLGYDRVSILAHSWGALLGLEYAARHPEAVRGLILMNPIEPGTRFQEQLERRQQAARTADDSTEIATLRALEGFEARDPATLSQYYRVVFRQSLRDRGRIGELDLDLAESTAKNGPDVARLIGESFGSVDWWDRLPTIQVPTLVLHGRYDVIPLAMSQALASALPMGRIVVLESGHFPYVEARDALLSAVSSFFVDLSR